MFCGINFHVAEHVIICKQIQPNEPYIILYNYCINYPIFHYLLICRLLKPIANIYSLDSDQARQNGGPDLGSKLFDSLMVLLKDFFKMFNQISC